MRRVTILGSSSFLLHYAGTRKLSSCDSSRKRYTPISLKDKVVLITGATAGIGEACAWRFAEEGAKLVLVGRRKEKLLNLQHELQDEFKYLKCHIEAISVTDTEKVMALTETLPSEFREVDILVNNAGLALGVSSVDTNNIDDAKTMLETNVLGTIAMCAAFTPGMKLRGYGHIINMGSIAGYVTYATGSVYNASKFAVLGFTTAARHDLIATPIRVSHISPGLVGNTEFSYVRLKDGEKAKAVYDNIQHLLPEDVADNVIYAATRPSHVQVADIITLCTNQSGPRDLARIGPGMGKL